MRHLLYILLTIATMLLTACVSKIHEEPELSTESTDPMRFTYARESEAHQAPTRASLPLLTSGFMVSTYKHYSAANQQTVMPQYEVEYFTSGTAWDGTVRPYWRYDLVSGQFLRYWDYSAFPYRFHAIAPYPSDPANFTLNDTQLTIPTAYYAQTCHNGMVTPSNATAEPHLVAQVQRGTDGTDTDTDLLAIDAEHTNLNNNSTTKSRDVWMPFHHLNSKVRFGVYHTTAWLTANKVYIEDLSISVTSAQFATEASGYQASVSRISDSWRILDDSNHGHAGFTGVNHAASSTSQPYTIFRYDGGPEIPDNDLTMCQTRKTAYWLQCPDGIMQIPQLDVQMTVSFVLRTEDGEMYKEFTNVPVRLENNTDPVTYKYAFDWQSGYINTYYLVIGEIDDKLEITFTATLTPWEDVTGTLSTDLEQ